MTKEDKLYWLSWCIEEYAYEHSISTPEVCELFTRQGVLSYLDQHSEVLHTLGRDYILKEISELLEKSH